MICFLFCYAFFFEFFLGGGVENEIYAAFPAPYGSLILLSGHIQFFFIFISFLLVLLGHILFFFIFMSRPSILLGHIQFFLASMSLFLFLSGYFSYLFAHMSHSLCLMGFHSYLFVHMSHSLCLMGFYSCLFCICPLFIQSGFITGNNDFPCMFHLLFGRRLHLFQCIRNPKFFPFKYPQRVIWQNFHTFHGF